MSKNYTTRTAALKAVTIDVNRLHVNKDGEYKNILELIPSSIHDSREIITENDLWGITVTSSKDGEVYIKHDWLGGEEISSEVKNTINSVTNNKAFDSSKQFKFNIESDRIKDGTYLFKASNITSFDGSLDNLIIGTGMFAETPLEYAGFALPNVEKGEHMFAKTSIPSISSAMPSLIRAEGMFNGTNSLISFKSDMPQLINGANMFENSNIKKFIANTPLLAYGNNMFANSNITDVDSIFYSLMSGLGMFENTNLSIESLRRIAESVPAVNFTNIKDNEEVLALQEGFSIDTKNSIWNNSIKDIVTTSVNFAVSKDKLGDISISWKNVNSLSEEEMIIAVYEYFKLLNLKGWTVASNLPENIADFYEEPLSVYGKVEITNINPTHINADGLKVKLHTASYVHYPVKGLNGNNTWKEAANIQELEDHFKLTPIS